jgi:SAM-dependent methyltransferase
LNPIKPDGKEDQEMDIQLKQLLSRNEFPLSSQYDPQWILENQMGLNPLWLTEWLCKDMALRPGMRVLDLGCGKGLSSVFLAREYDVQVWAADLWIKPTENYRRFQQASVSERVFPIYTEARSLPFAEAFFDAIVCIDAYIYFGTDDLYLDYLQRYVRPGGKIGITVPGFMQEVSGSLPEHLLPFWAQECWTWHTVAWWERLWNRTGLVTVEVAEPLPEGWKLWLLWKKARAVNGEDSEALRSDIQVLENDQGSYMGFLRMIART